MRHFCSGDTYFCFTKYGARKIGGTPHAFHLYLSIFHIGQIKGKPWEKKLGQQLVLLFAPKVKTKRTLSMGHLRLVAIWDLPLKCSFETVDWANGSLAGQGCYC